MDNDISFPKVSKSISDYLYEEEGNISREKVLFIGSLIIIVGAMLRPINAFAGHASHSSHASHASHASSATAPRPVAPTHSSAAAAPAHSSAPAPVVSTPTPVPSAPVVPDPTPQIPQVPIATSIPN